jgi:hypothetical protein
LEEVELVELVEVVVWQDQMVILLYFQQLQVQVEEVEQGKEMVL